MAKVVKTPDVSAGTTITFSTSSWATAGRLKSLSWSGMSRPAIDTTALNATAVHTFMPGDLYDAGELTLEMMLDTDLKPIIDAVPEVTITITFPDTFTWSAAGFMTDYSFSVPETDSGLMTATAKFKMSSTLAVSDAS